MPKVNWNVLEGYFNFVFSSVRCIWQCIGNFKNYGRGDKGKNEFKSVKGTWEFSVVIVF